MLVQYENPKALKDEYWGLRDDMQYRVIGIASYLVKKPFQGKEKDIYAILVDKYNRDSNGVITAGRANFVPFEWLEIIDYTYPKDWQSGIISEGISRPVLVFGFKELLDVGFYIRIHDLDEEDSDNELLAQHLNMYGGNIFISEEERNARSQYVSAEYKMDQIIKEVNHELDDNKLCNRYLELISLSLSSRLKVISMTTNKKQKRILAENSAYYLTYIKGCEAEIPENLERFRIGPSGHLMPYHEIVDEVLKMARAVV